MIYILRSLLTVVHNRKLRVHQDTRVVTAQLNDVLKHGKEVTFVVFLLQIVWFCVIVVCFLVIVLPIKTRVFNWNVGNRSLALVDDVQSPYSLQKTEKYSILKFLLQLLEREDWSGIIERMCAEDKGGVVKLKTDIHPIVDDSWSIGKIEK